MKTYFTTEDAFPTVLRRSEVIGLQNEDISPIENAINDVEMKTRELSTLHIKYSSLARTGQPLATNTLSMTLNGALDAPINGGITLYRQAFLTPEYLQSHEDRGELVQKLRDAIDEHVSR